MQHLKTRGNKSVYYSLCQWLWLCYELRVWENRFALTPWSFGPVHNTRIWPIFIWNYFVHQLPTADIHFYQVNVCVCILCMHCQWTKAIEADYLVRNYRKEYSSIITYNKWLFLCPSGHIFTFSLFRLCS